MYIIKYSNKASIELDKIYSYIAEDNNFYAANVVENISNTINNFSLFPYLGVRLGILRRFVENKYKFIIVYKINDRKKIITIVSIFKNRNNF